MISNDTKFGYEKILGLRGDRTKKRSLEARADAYSRLKKSQGLYLTKKRYNLPFVIFQNFSDLQWWLMGVISLFVAVLGLTSNLVACIVLLQKKMRNAFNELLTILATFDSLFLIFNGVGSLYVLNPSLGMWQFTT